MGNSLPLGRFSGGSWHDARAEQVFGSFRKKYMEILRAKRSTARDDRQLATAVVLRVRAQLLLSAGGNIQLDFANTVFGDEACVALAHALTIHDCVTVLGLHNAGIGFRGVSALSILLKRSEVLHDLDLSGNLLGSGAICVLAHSLLAAGETQRGCLSELSLSSAAVDDSDASALSDVLFQNRTLRVLDLSANKIGVHGSERLAAAMLGNESLTRLDLRRNAGVPPNHVHAIDAILERNSVVFEVLEHIIKIPARKEERRFKTKRDTFKLSVHQKRQIHEQLSGGTTPSVEQPSNQHSYSVLAGTSSTSMQRSIRTVGTEGAVASDRYDAGCAEMQGRRPDMQDCTVLRGQFAGRADYDFYAVFDGHGGREPAEYAARRLPDLLAQQFPSDVNVMREWVSECFVKCGDEMSEWCPYRGTTACLAMVLRDVLWVANVGDTRAVLCRDGVSIRLSKDHKPALEEESRRIMDMGGFVQDDRVSGLLAVSRAFGDSFLKPFVISEPYIRSLNVKDADEFVIIACDGVWDVVSDHVAVELVRKHIDATKAAEELRDFAYALGSTDNISVVVFFFSPPIDPVDTDLFQEEEEETRRKQELNAAARRKAAENEMERKRVHDKQVARIVREEEIMRHRSQSEEDLKEAREMAAWLGEHPNEEPVWAQELRHAPRVRNW